MHKLATASLFLVLVLLSLSAWLRLEHSGIGCEPWPQCYGQIGTTNSSQSVVATYERLAAEARQPVSRATRWHRLVAGILGVLIVVMAILGQARRRDRLLTLGLLAVTAFLAWLGIYSEGLQSVAVVMGNLGGGFLMAGLLGWMVFRQSDPPARQTAAERRAHCLAVASLAVVAMQILLGGLTSANFAATACQTLPDCHGSWLPGAEVGAAFDLRRVHEVDAEGKVISGGPERAAIHQLHRLVAVATALLALLAGMAAMRAGRACRTAGGLVILVVLVEFGVGTAAVTAKLPIALAVAHNWLAAILLLALLAVIANSRPGLQELR